MQLNIRTVVAFFFIIGLFVYANPVISYDSDYSAISSQKTHLFQEMLNNKILSLPRRFNISYQEIAVFYPEIISASSVKEKVAFMIVDSILTHVDPVNSLHGSAKKILHENLPSLGDIFIFQQEYEDIHVKGASAKILFDDRRQIIKVSQFFQPLHKVEAGIISYFDALDSVQDFTQQLPHEALLNNSLSFMRQVILPYEEHSIVAWEIFWPQEYVLDNRYFYVNAVSGEIVSAENRIFTHSSAERKAHVFTPSPGKKSDYTKTTTVTLQHIHDNEKGFFNGELIHTVNCLLVNEFGNTSTLTITLPESYSKNSSFPLADTIILPFCTEKPLASYLDDPHKNYIYQPSETDNPATDEHENWEDRFAEVHAYYHTNFVYEHIRELLGDNEWTVESVPLQVNTNFLIPVLNPTADSLFQLGPFDSAFFMPGDEAAKALSTFGVNRGFDNIILGQGQDADHAYDATIVYHEFMHGVIEKYVTLHTTLIGKHGMRSDPRAINEAFSDYFSLSTAKVDVYGEYLNAHYPQKTLESRGGEFQRFPHNDNRCPDNISGEEHHDGKIWLGSMWSIRKHAISLGISENEFDRTVLNTIISDLSDESTFEDAADGILRILQLSFGNDVSEYAQKVFVERGVLECERILPIELNNAQDVFLVLAGTLGKENYHYMPAAMQYKAEIPADFSHVSIEVTINNDAAQATALFYDPLGIILGIKSSPKIGVLLKKDFPITFSAGNTYKNTLSDNSDIFGELVFSEEDPNKGTLVIELPSSCGGMYYFSLVNLNDKPVIIKKIDVSNDNEHFVSACANDVDTIDTTTVTDTTAADSGNGRDMLSAKKEKDAGCGCSEVSQDSTMIFHLMFLSLLGLRLFNRKKQTYIK